jgi:hypothetical protein
MDMNFNHFFEINVLNNEEPKEDHKGFYSFSTMIIPQMENRLSFQVM